MSMSSLQREFVEKVYRAGINAGLSDAQARVAASQAALETEYGKRVKGNNFFGIKAGSSWKGDTQTFRTWEEVNGKRVNITDRFRAYDTPEDSLRDWKSLIGRRFPDVFTAEDFKSATKGLRYGQKGGYATDSKYGSKLDWINRNFLDRVAPETAVASRLPDQGPVPQFAPRDTMGSGILSGQYAVKARDLAPVSRANAASLPGNTALLNFNRTMGTAPDIADDARNIAFTSPDVPVTLRPDRRMPSGLLAGQTFAPHTPEPVAPSFGLPPVPGLQPSPIRTPQIQAPQVAPQNVPVWDQPVNTEFPPAPQPKQTLGQQIRKGILPMAASVGGGMLAGPVGALAGGVIARKLQEKGLLNLPAMQGILSGERPEAMFYTGGFNPRASSYVQSGYAPAGAAYQDSAGGWSMSYGNGYSERTNKYGNRTVTTPDGRDADTFGGGLFGRMFG